MILSQNDNAKKFQFADNTLKSTYKRIVHQNLYILTTYMYMLHLRTDRRMHQLYYNVQL